MEALPPASSKGDWAIRLNRVKLVGAWVKEEGTHFTETHTLLFSASIFVQSRDRAADIPLSLAFPTDH